jgi:hypothetical protein
MHSEYIEQRNGGYYVAGTRISLDSVVCAFNREHPAIRGESRALGEAPSCPRQNE